MYYRIAIQINTLPQWQWKSTALSDLSTLFQWFRLYHILPQDRLRVFSSHTRAELNDQLVRENQGLESTSIPALQFLRDCKINLTPEAQHGAPDPSTNKHQSTTPITNTTPSLPLPENSSRTYPLYEGMSAFEMNALERRRLELENGAGGDHDSVYTFTLPSSIPQFLAWLKLRDRMQEEILELAASLV